MHFNFTKIQAVNFGVCLNTEAGESYRLVPSEGGVQDALKTMLGDTIAALKQHGTNIEEFSPAENTEQLNASRFP